MDQKMDAQELLLYAFTRYQILIGAVDAPPEMAQDCAKDAVEYPEMVMKLGGKPNFNDDDCVVFMIGIIPEWNQKISSDTCRGFIFGYHSAISGSDADEAEED